MLGIGRPTPRAERPVSIKTGWPETLGLCLLEQPILVFLLLV